MKKTLLSILSLLITLCSFSQGIQFEHGTWTEVLEKAKISQKPIFIDVFTTWCGPCNMMSNEVFPLAEVGKVYNTNFICYKVDAEKGEGAIIANQYAVNAFPTYLFLKADKSLIMKSVGRMPADKFISLSENVKEELGTSKTITVWDKEYVQKKSDSSFLLAYMHKRSRLGMKNAALFDEYLTLLPNEKRATKDVIELYKQEGENLKITSVAYKNLQTNAFVLYPQLGGYSNSILSFAVENSFKEAIKTKNELLLQQVIDANENIPKIQQPKQKEEFYIGYYKGTKEIDKYVSHATTYSETTLMTVSLDTIEKQDKANYQIFEQSKGLYLSMMKDSARVKELGDYMAHTIHSKYSEALNDIAWGFFENVSDTKALENALRWSKRSLEIYPSEESADTYANLLYKLGRKEEAIIKEKEALEIAKTKKSETKSYEDVIKKMKAGEKTWK